MTGINPNIFSPNGLGASPLAPSPDFNFGPPIPGAGQFPAPGTSPSVFSADNNIFGTASEVTTHADGTGNDADISPAGKKIADQTQKMLAEQRAFQLLMAKIKNDHSMRQAFITALRQQATDNKNSFN